MFDNFSLQLLRQQNNGIFFWLCARYNSLYICIWNKYFGTYVCICDWIRSSFPPWLKSRMHSCQIFLIWEIIENMCYNVWNQINRQLMFAHWEAFLMEKVIASVYVFLETLVILSTCHTVLLGWHNRWLELQYIAFR